MRDARLLAAVLVDPTQGLALASDEWISLLTIARAELLLGTLALRLDGLDVPPAVAAILADARREAEHQRCQALWEAEMARRALAGVDAPVILLKGTAYVSAGLSAGQGRHIGDLDILVPRAAIAAVEAELLAAGWEWVKPDPYDDAYYRRWMHELPPLIHRERDRMIDVHHTILPLTARPRPDASALIANSVPLENGLRVLSPADMIIHAAAHLFADGDLAGGMRNLWDIDRLVREFSEQDENFCLAVFEQAWSHGLLPSVERALRLSRRIFVTPVTGYRLPIRIQLDERVSDRFVERRLLARDGWGNATRPVTRLGFYLRSHWLRMPPAMLARHLWTKWRLGGGGKAR